MSFGADEIPGEELEQCVHDILRAARENDGRCLRVLCIDAGKIRTSTPCSIDAGALLELLRPHALLESLQLPCALFLGEDAAEAVAASCPAIRKLACAFEDDEAMAPLADLPLEELTVLVGGSYGEGALRSFLSGRAGRALRSIALYDNGESRDDPPRFDRGALEVLARLPKLRNLEHPLPVLSFVTLLHEFGSLDRFRELRSVHLRVGSRFELESIGFLAGAMVQWMEATSMGQLNLLRRLERVTVSAARNVALAPPVDLFLYNPARIELVWAGQPPAPWMSTSTAAHAATGPHM
eukprot:tig00021179_g19253.t1